MTKPLRLGVNIDHVATLRNARGGVRPAPLEAARRVAAAGADGLTVHLREDRRHIRDDDVTALKAAALLPLNLEMAATDEMVAIARRVRPHAACLVPERREELTTEGGLAVAGATATLAPVVAALAGAGIRVSLFIDPDPPQIAAAAAVGATAIELHTGAYCEAAPGEARAAESARLARAADQAAGLGLEVHAGHGLDYDTVPAVAALAPVVELNIGHFLVAEALWVGLEAAVRRMIQVMAEARAAAAGVVP